MKLVLNDDYSFQRETSWYDDPDSMTKDEVAGYITRMRDFLKGLPDDLDDPAGTVGDIINLLDNFHNPSSIEYLSHSVKAWQFIEEYERKMGELSDALDECYRLIKEWRNGTITAWEASCTIETTVDMLNHDIWEMRTKDIIDWGER